MTWRSSGPPTAPPMRLSFVLALGLLLLPACDSTDTDAGRANLTVRLTDAPFPFDLAAAANVTLTRIELVASDDAGPDSTDDGSPRVVLYDGAPIALNLLDLRDGVDTVLVRSLSVPADGAHRQLRFYLGDEASVEFLDGSVYDLRLPSAQQSGVKVMLPPFEGDGQDVDVLVDFDVEKSFVVLGNPGSPSFNGFLFKPVLEVETFDVLPPADSTGL